jgi:uncharacterized protein (TIGR03663 family)
MAIDTITRPTTHSPLERQIDLARINWEIVSYLVIVALSVVAHLWNLGAMAMHHDESIHAWTSWRFYTGAGSFNCWGDQIAPTYCYDPVYHGPSLYVLTLISFFLFGDGDAQSRLPMAVAGMAMVASCWWLRPYLGRRGALLAAVLVGFTPSLLYYTRFARHDGLMVLWEIWMVIGVLRWLDSGKPGWLYLTSAALALAIATHELYYILFFIFGLFVLMRLLAESPLARYLNIGLLAALGLSVILMVLNPPLPIGEGLYFGEKAFLIASALVLAWLCQRLWDPTPMLLPRLRTTWQENRGSLWIALAILVSIYTLLYSTFFAYPRGAIDGLYAGLAYWLGSQQEYARGDQPWYYYLMQLPIYEPLAVLSGLGMVGYMVVEVIRRALANRPAPQNKPVIVAKSDEASDEENAENEEQAADTADSAEEGPVQENSDSSPVSVPSSQPLPLFPLLLVFWFFTAVIIFSWAGEKMPWLVVHMALPGNLLAAWVLSKLLEISDKRVEVLEPEVQSPNHSMAQSPITNLQSQYWLVPLVSFLMLIALGVALWRLGQPTAGQAGQSSLLQGLVPLFIAGGLLYALLTIAQRIGGRVVLALFGVTLALGLGGYTLRATWMAVYEHPDTPIELLVYTQTSPDVPRIVTDVRELAVNLTRNNRTPGDATGGLSMPIIIDSGNSSGEGSLAWPVQWYLRDFQRINWKKGDELANNPNFDVQFPDGSNGLAPVIMLARPNVNDSLREALRQNYTQPYGPSSVFNWWFPEGNKCAPQEPGYKRFYYSTWTPTEELIQGGGGGSGGCGRDISAELNGPFAALGWPLQGENWDKLYKFMLYRQLPYPLVPGSREMEIWVRRDLSTSADPSEAGSASSGNLKLVADQALNLPNGGNGPTGVAVDSRGTVYVADTNNHQVHVFDSQGNLVRSFGGLGNGQQQFFEPRGLAVDVQDNLYVADTWNARIIKFGPDGTWLASWGSGDKELPEGRRATITDGTQAGNAAAPLGFYGPRGLAVDKEGNVYIADTGNKRVVVTDNEGNFLYQFGYFGSEPGAFNEPTGLALDGQGNLYVADTWNSRVQVFAPDGSGQLGQIPIVTWRVSGWKSGTYEDPSIAASPDGRVFVSVPLQQAVLGANLRGDVSIRWGGTGDDLASLNAPSGMAVSPDGSVYVVDRTAGRVLRFTLPNVQFR